MRMEFSRDRLPLLPFEQFRVINEMLGGGKIFYAHGIGNAGDTLIHAGAYCLFEQFNIQLTLELTDADAFVWGGGGNLGTLYKRTYLKRRRLIGLANLHRKPVIIFPQSITNSAEEMPKHATVLVREKISQEMLPNSILIPDTAFAYNGPIHLRDSIYELGVFLRADVEQACTIYSDLSLGDIAKICKDYLGYFKIAGLFETIVTDRLHFAIAALMLERRVVLLPNSYYKNRAMYDSWLSPLGCLWGVDAMLDSVKHYRYSPAKLEGWNAA